MRKSIIIAALAGFAAIAWANEIESRQEAMKTIGGGLKALSAIAKGEAEFDAALVEMKLTEIQDAAASLPDLFPEGSLDEESEASPAIWENREDFDGLVEKFIKDTTIETLPADEFELADTLKVIGGNCKGCHEDYRIKKD